jgi:primosomal protein N' (replication factor Y)
VSTEPVARFARVALDLPASQLGSSWFDYALDPETAAAIAAGSWVLVPWGQGRRVGLVVALAEHSEVDPARIRSVIGPLAGAPRAGPEWLRLLEFAAGYYHRGLGEVALPAVPKILRTPPAPRARGSAFERARQRFASAAGQARPETAPSLSAASIAPTPEPNEAQRAALAGLASKQGFLVTLLHGVTGSGKTEVYLRWLAAVLARDPSSQVLLLVPEIALTPQLAEQVGARFPGEPLAILHSDLPDGDRAAHWLAAAEGRARVVIGTRLAVLAPMPGLAAIVVDEEHDPSYKQQEGVRYSARDLAIMVASQRDLPVVLGSATPSLESWLAARRGRYRLLRLPQRIGDAALPVPEVLDLRHKALQHQLAPRSVQAIRDTLLRGEQALVFINRRGYAPVLGCDQCGWLSRCADCSAYRVLHRAGTTAREPGQAVRYRLVCHHCAAEQRVPRTCPDCGNVDLRGLGQGTQRLEEGLAELFPEARIARLDRDVASRRGAARKVLDAAHAGEIDILVGTQMLAKGHDFRRLSLVVAVDCDGGLFSADYRAPERLFATLMQVAGRAGRDARASRVLLQTRFPEHPLFACLVRHDYEGFADAQLAEREQAGLPPWRHQALLRAEASGQAAALAFLAQAREIGQSLPEAAGVTLLDPVPMAMSRLAGRDRAQLLIECAARPPLHRFLDAWLPRLRELPGRARWALDVDPAEI